MKKKVIVFVAGLAVCSLLAIAGHITATAETDPQSSYAPLPTDMPDYAASQNKNIQSEYKYYIDDTDSTSATSLRRLDTAKSNLDVEPTPMPELQANETAMEETVEYFEADDGSIWKVVSSARWVTPETSSSETESTMAAANDYEEKILICTRTVWHRSGILEHKVATIDAAYTVWYYTNVDRVHLRHRDYTTKLFDSDYSTQIIYGNIVNTDGSVSYISGDKFRTTKNGNSKDYDLNFVVTPTTYSFD